MIGVEEGGGLTLANQRGEALLALDVWERRQVLAIDLQRVEQEEREPAPALADRLLERGEVASALVVELDDLAVEKRRADLQLARLLDDLRELVGPVEARAGIDLRLAAADAEQAAIAIELHLMDPGGAGRHMIHQRRLLRLTKLGRLRSSPGRGGGPRALSGRWRGLRATCRGPIDRRRGTSSHRLLKRRQLLRALASGDVLHRAAGLDAGQVLFGQDRPAAGMFVLDLAEDPVLRAVAGARLQPDHDPFALHPLAIQGEVEVPLFERLARVLARVRLPGAAVPQHHSSAAILSLRDRAFEQGVAQRMILRANREALIGRVEARSTGHSPALQRSVELQAEVIVQPRGVMLLDDEALAAAPVERLDPAARLRGFAEVALLVVCPERIGFRHSA